DALQAREHPEPERSPEDRGREDRVRLAAVVVRDHLRVREDLRDVAGLGERRGVAPVAVRHRQSRRRARHLRGYLRHALSFSFPAFVMRSTRVVLFRSNSLTRSACASRSAPMSTRVLFWLLNVASGLPSSATTASASSS